MGTNANRQDTSKDPGTKAFTPYAYTPAATAARSPIAPAGSIQGAGWTGATDYTLPYPNAPHDGGVQDQANNAAIIKQLETYNSQQALSATAPDWLDQVALAVNVASVTAGLGAAIGPAVGAAAGGGTGGTIAGGAATGAAGGLVQSALTGQNVGKNVLTGAATGAFGGALKAATPAIASYTGIPAPVVTAAGKGVSGAITGGLPGAVTGAAGSLATSGLQEAGLPSGLAKTGGSYLGSELGREVSGGGAGKTMPSANTMYAGGPGGDPRLGTNIQVADQGAAGDGSASNLQLAGLAGGVGAAQETTPTGDTSSSGPSLSGLAGVLNGIGVPAGLASGLSGAAPYLLSGGLGLYQAAQANAQNKQAVSDIGNLGKPYTQAGQQLLTQAQSGQLNPAQQNVVSTLSAQGKNLIDSASPLSQIANTAFANYQAGQLNPGQQQQIDAWTTSAKQQLRQTLASSGIADSSILASQDAAIDSQATQLKANLMAQNLQVGDQQYSQWLTSTQAGQQLIAQGAQYAATSLDTMLSQALSLGSFGAGVQADAIKLGLQQDQILSNNVSNLMKSLTSAYAVANKPSGVGGGVGGGAAGQVANALGAGGNNNLYAAGTAAALRLAGGGNAITAGSNNVPGEPGNIQPLTQDQLQVPDINSTISGMNTSFGGDGSYSLNSDNTVDTSSFNNYFYDPGSADLPIVDFGSDQTWP